MNTLDSRYGLQFHDHEIFHHQVNPVTRIEVYLSKPYGYAELTLDPEPTG